MQVSSVKRLDKFREAVQANHLISATVPDFQAYYNRLYITRRVAEFILSALIIFGGHQLIIINSFFSPVWPAAGVALSALFLRGNTLLAGIFAGTLTSYLYNHFSFVMGLRQSLAFTLCILLVRSLSLKWSGPISPLYSKKVLWQFSLIAILCCAVHVSVMGLMFTQANDTSITWYGWSVAFLGELNGILCLAPLSLVFDPFVVLHYFNKKNRTWQLVAAFIVLAHIFSFIIQGIPSILLTLSFFILLCTFAYYFGLIPLCITLFGVSIVYIAGALPHAHLFHYNSSHLETFSIMLIFTMTILISLSIAIDKQRNLYEQHKIRNPH